MAGYFDLEMDCTKATICNCTSSIEFNENLSIVMPYIFPFTIEFNILVGKLFLTKKNPSEIQKLFHFYLNSWNLVYHVESCWQSG